MFINKNDNKNKNKNIANKKYSSLSKHVNHQCK